MKRYVMPLVALMLAAGCADKPPADPRTPPTISRAAPGAFESKSSKLITFPCLSGTEPNHMASKPASGCPLQTELGVTDSQSLWGMEYIQRFRRHLGLPCLEMRDYAQSAATWHAVYMSTHATFLGGLSACFMDGHSEKIGCDYFSGESPRDQLINNGMPLEWDEYNGQVTSEARGCKLSASDAAAGWMAAPFHREAWMEPSSDFAGFTTFWQNHAAVETWANAMTFSRRQDWQDDGSNDPTILRYPKRNDTGVPRWFSGVESPQPPVPPTGWPSGYPVTILAKEGAGFVWSSATFCESLSGTTCSAPVPFTGIFTNSRVAHIYANTKMKANKRYWVRFFGTQDGSPVSDDWAFTTGDK